KSVALETARTLAKSLAITPNEAARSGIAISQDGQRRSAFELMSHPDIGFAEVTRLWPQLKEIAPDVAGQLEIDAKYAVYLERQQVMNLVAASTLSTLWTRHVADSLQLLPLAPDARTWADLGSGAGFPGLVIACALADTSGASMHLVDSTKKKATFLAETAA